MSSDEALRQELVKRYQFLESKIRLVRPRRVHIDVDSENFTEIFQYLVDQQKFTILCMITGLDEGENLSLIYHLAQDAGTVLNLKVSVPKTSPVVKSVISVFPGAEIYEREVVDLFGVDVTGLPPGNRYPLTDDWPAQDHPLRKDWKSNGSCGQEASHA